MTDRTEEDLTREIRQLATEYYEGHPSKSDEYFDQLVEQLRQLNPNHPILTTTGWGYKPQSNKEVLPHDFPISGITDKYYETDPLASNLSTYAYITPKLDGGTIVLTYRDGRLLKALTRGDGTEGTNVLDIIWQIPTIPHQLKGGLDITIRGEFFHLGTNACDRNKANGLLMRKDYTLTGDDKSRFTALFYAILNSKEDYLSDLQTLSNLGFKVPKVAKIRRGDLTSDAQAEKFLKVLTNYKLGEFSYTAPVDGIVCALNGSKKLVAYKINTTAVTSRVTHIEWRVSDVGRLIPIVEIEPVDLDGVTVSRATGNNYEWLLRNRIYVGATVNVIRAGGVIPQISAHDPSGAPLRPSDPNFAKLMDLPQDHKYKIEDSHLVLIGDELKQLEEKATLYRIFRFFGKNYRLSDSFYNKVLGRTHIFDSLEQLHKFMEESENYELAAKNYSFAYQLSASQQSNLTKLFEDLHTWEPNVTQILDFCAIDGLGPQMSKSINSQYKSIASFLKGYSLSPHLNVRVKNSVRSKEWLVSKVAKIFVI